MKDHYIPVSAQNNLRLMLRESSLDTMQPCRSLKIYNNRRKRLTQIALRATRCI